MALTSLMPASWSALSPLMAPAVDWRARSRATPPPERCLLPRRAGGVQGVFDAGLLFLHFDFGGSADL